MSGRWAGSPGWPHGACGFSAASESYVPSARRRFKRSRPRHPGTRRHGTYYSSTPPLSNDRFAGRRPWEARRVGGDAGSGLRARHRHRRSSTGDIGAVANGVGRPVGGRRRVMGMGLDWIADAVFLVEPSSQVDEAAPPGAERSVPGVLAPVDRHLTPAGWAHVGRHRDRRSRAAGGYQAALVSPPPLLFFLAVWPPLVVLFVVSGLVLSLASDEVEVRASFSALAAFL